MIAAASITFFWLVSDMRPALSKITFDEGALRRAIAGSIVVEYLVLVGVVAFWEGGPETLPPITQALITSFTTVVGVVIAFYFGSSAYVEAKTRRTLGGAGTPVGDSKASSAQPTLPADAQAARN